MPPEQDPSPVPLCASAELEERGRAHTFDVLHFRQPARADRRRQVLGLRTA